MPSCPAFRTASTAPLPGGHGFKPKPASSCTLVPSPAQAVLTSSQVPRDEAEEDADDVTQVRSAAVLALLQPQGGVPSWARVSPRPAILALAQGPPARPAPPSLCPPLCPPLPSLEGTLAFIRCFLPPLVCLLISVPALRSQSPSVSQPLCSCPVLCALFTSPALGLSQDCLLPVSALHLAPDPGSSGPGAPLPGDRRAPAASWDGEGEGGVGCIPEFHHHWGRVPCVIFN